MTLEIFISSAVVSAFIAAVGHIITERMARTTAKETAKETTNREIMKLERTWDREDELSADDEFGEMVKLTILCVSDVGEGPFKALAAIGALRSKESGELAEALDNLYQAVKSRSFAEADKQLDTAISIKRLRRNK